MTGFSGAHTGRVAVVTGAAAGLGRAYAQRLARDGAHVVVADVSNGAETVETIVRSGGDAIAAECDVTSSDAVAALRDLTDERFGRCDILVNNAGVIPSTPWDELDFDAWRRVLSINLDGMFLMCKAFAPGMVKNGFGRIVNISSNTYGLVIPGFVHYVASKAGVIGLTRGLATELGNDGITVNCVLPGLTITPRIEAVLKKDAHVLDSVVAMQAIKRPGVPADLEGPISFLATEDARWITGQTIVVDGGQLRH